LLTHNTFVSGGGPPAVAVCPSIVAASPWKDTMIAEMISMASHSDLPISIANMGCFYQ
jgi:hypothetical protein